MRDRILIIFCLFFILHLEAKIIETRYFIEALPFIDQDTWFLVDLDNALFEGKQALGHANQFYDELEKRITRGMSKEEAIQDYYPEWIRSQRICEVKPLEENSVALLLALQNQGITIMGLTHRQVFVADSTLRQIASLGLDFSKTAPDKKHFIVPAKHPTLYTQGVLFVSDYNQKGEVLRTFWQMLQQKPKKVVFIDDKRKNVEELERLLAQEEVDYVGIHYTAIDYAKPIYNAEIAVFQRRFFDKIMSNEAAQILMEKGIE